MVAVTVEALMDAPTDRAGITITGLGAGDSIVSLWRTADGARESVSGYRRVLMNDAAFVEDVYCPVGRNVVYEVEVISGPLGASRTSATPVFLPAATGWLMDAMVPQNAVRVVGERRTNGDVYLRGEALASRERQANVSLFEIMGSSKPMALIGQRMAETGLDTSLGVRSEEENAKLEAMLGSSAQLVFRPLPEWGDLGLAGAMHLANAKFRRLPVNVQYGGNLTWWELVSDVVQAPAIRVLTATFTWGDVAIMFDSWGQKQAAIEASAAAAGEPATWLYDLKHPLG